MRINPFGSLCPGPELVCLPICLWFATFMSHLVLLTLGFRETPMNCEQIIRATLLLTITLLVPQREMNGKIPHLFILLKVTVSAVFMLASLFFWDHISFFFFWDPLTTPWWEGIHSLHRCYKQREREIDKQQQNEVSEDYDTDGKCTKGTEDFTVAPVLQAGGILHQLWETPSFSLCSFHPRWAFKASGE